ncbi:hypothetical protein DY000_02037022 [Brassica cretica]|uniref:Uncharacterized protein n=1 Tax=Brassica cretica TaxID=69181 RepID=A0ABQ7B8Y9_BRACR|nr:hypothetical protein DY000_02037022 [Brassica cretica]
MFPRNSVGIFRGNSEETQNLGFLGISSEIPRKILRISFSVGMSVRIPMFSCSVNSRVDADEEEAKTVIQISCGFEERLLCSIKNRFDFTVLSDENITDFFHGEFFVQRDPWDWETGREMQVHRPCGVDRGVLRGGRIHGYLSTQPNPCFFVD